MDRRINGIGGPSGTVEPGGKGGSGGTVGSGGIGGPGGKSGPGGIVRSGGIGGSGGTVEPGGKGESNRKGSSGGGGAESRLDGSRTFFTADTHFGDEKVLRLCKRPFGSVAEMDQALIENWNRVVGPRDMVFHLGDFCAGDSRRWNELLDSLNGRIYLVLGNHDIHQVRRTVLRRFRATAMQMVLRFGKQVVYLNHFPFLCYGGYYKGAWQLFGHVHSGENMSGQDIPRLSMLLPTQYDVGVDNNNYAPVSYNHVAEIIRRQCSGSV